MLRLHHMLTYGQNNIFMYKNVKLFIELIFFSRTQYYMKEIWEKKNSNKIDLNGVLSYNLVLF